MNRAVPVRNVRMIVQAYERPVTLALMHGMLSALEHAADAVEQAIIVLHPSGHIQFATHAAKASLSELPSPDQPGSLPEPLASWSEAQRRRAGAALPFVEPSAWLSPRCCAHPRCSPAGGGSARPRSRWRAALAGGTRSDARQPAGGTPRRRARAG